MIGALFGTIRETRENRVLIDVRGVYYEVEVAGSVLAAQSGEEQLVYIHTDVRETAITLFGFSSALEKEVFLMLKKVKGVGSKVALAVLSSLGTETLLRAIGSEDVGQLKRVPGVGKKTAERMLVELVEQVHEFVDKKGLSAQIEVAADRADSSLTLTTAAEDAMLALRKLGFNQERAAKAVRESLEADASAHTLDAGELLKQSLSRV